MLNGRGPALLDVECYRISGHSTTDANVYRSRDELKLWESHDTIGNFAAKLIEPGVCGEEAVSAMREDVKEQITRITASAVDPAIAPKVNVAADPTLIGEKMFADTHRPLPNILQPVLKDPAQVAAFKSLARKARFGLDEDGNPRSPMRAVTVRDGLVETILHQISTTRFSSPMAKNAASGAALSASITGLRTSCPITGCSTRPFPKLQS